MADRIHQLALDAVYAFGGVGATIVPKSGSGPVSGMVVVRPLRDQIVNFPQLRGLLGAALVGWQIDVRFTEYPLRFVAGDRVTLFDGTVHEVRVCSQHPRAAAWRLETFIVEPDETVTDDAFMLPIYFAGVTELGL